jgi:hypothetical protein
MLTTVVGTGADGITPVRGFIPLDLSFAGTEDTIQILVEYETSSDQANYVKCQVGGSASTWLADHLVSPVGLWVWCLSERPFPFATSTIVVKSGGKQTRPPITNPSVKRCAPAEISPSAVGITIGI